MSKKNEPEQQTRACDIMTKPVQTVRSRDGLRDVARLFNEKSISAAVVLDDDGSAAGVITKTDLVRFEDEHDESITVDKLAEPVTANGIVSGYHLIDPGEKVEFWMTPIVYSVPLETAMTEVARQMIRHGTHHIFVRGRTEKDIVGVVSSFDILRRIAAKEFQ